MTDTSNLLDLFLRLTDDRSRPRLAVRCAVKRCVRMLLIAPLLLFILITFVVPIGQMLFRSVENQIVSDVLPRTTKALRSWS